MGRRAWAVLRTGVVLVVALGLLLGCRGPGDPAGGDGRDATERPAGIASGTTDPASGLPWVRPEQLPAEAEETLALIDAGGPFPYDQDDETFFNREGLLPDRPEGYYREYTVDTPGEDDRGPRRIVTGADGEYYWTSDHYASFERIAR